MLNFSKWVSFRKDLIWPDSISCNKKVEMNKKEVFYSRRMNPFGQKLAQKRFYLHVARFTYTI